MQTIHLGDQDYIILPRSEYERLKTLAKLQESPTLPNADADGNFPAMAFARASLARDIVRDRVAAGLSQKELAARSGVRVETLCRLETGKVTPSLATVRKLDDVLKQHARQNAGSQATKGTKKSAAKKRK